MLILYYIAFADLPHLRKFRDRTDGKKIVIVGAAFGHF